MIEFDVLIDGEFVYTQRSTGSSSLADWFDRLRASANGPILHPRVAGIALVPLCPHALTARPITCPTLCDRDRRRPAARRTGSFRRADALRCGAGIGSASRARLHTVTLLHPEGTVISTCCAKASLELFAAHSERPPTMLRRLQIRDFVIVDRLELSSVALLAR